MNHNPDQLVENLFEDKEHFLEAFTGMTLEEFGNLMNKVNEQIAPAIDAEVATYNMGAKVNAVNSMEELQTMDLPVVSTSVFRGVGKIIDTIDAPFHVRILVLLETRKTVMRTIQEYMNKLFETRLRTLAQHKIVIPRSKL